MSQDDRRRWNERWTERQTRGAVDELPLPRLVRHEEVLRPAPGTARLALDLACGAGRHALYLAALGYAVDAWDVSDVAIELLAGAARRRGLDQRVRPLQVDLDAATLPPDAYDLLVDAYFLDRRLLPAMAGAVKRGGLLFMETLLATPAQPGRLDFYLQPGELRGALPGFAELYYEEAPTEGRATLLARKPVEHGQFHSGT